MYSFNNPDTQTFAADSIINLGKLFENENELETKTELDERKVSDLNRKKKDIGEELAVAAEELTKDKQELVEIKNIQRQQIQSMTPRKRMLADITFKAGIKQGAKRRKSA
jgi:hypothetical protein